MIPNTIDELVNRGPRVGFRVKDKWGVAVEPGFQAIPDVLILYQYSLGISSEELNVLLSLTLHWWRVDDVVFPRTTTIASRMGVSLRSVQRAMKGLVKKELVARRKTGDGRSYYDLKPLKARLEALAVRELEQREGGVWKRKGPSEIAEAFEAA